MRKSTRIAGAVVAVSALVAPLAACSSSSGDADGKVEINFFHRWPNEPKNAYFSELVKEFEADNPDIKVNVESVLNDSYKDKVKVVAGGENAPDVMFSWSGSFIEELVDGGNVMDLTHWLADNPDIKDRYYESQMEPFAIDGAQYGLPIGMQAKLFFYNKDVFDDLGIEPPETWSEFESVLGTIQDADMTPIEFGAQEQWPIAHYVGTLNQRTLSPEVFAADQDPAKGEFTDQGYVDALKSLQEIASYANPDATAVGHEAARNAWIAGEAPIMYMQGPEIAYFEDADFEFGTFNFPSVDGGKGDPLQLTGAPEGFVVAANSKHPEESLRFLEFMLNKTNGIKYTEETGELSAVVGAVDEADAPQALKDIANEIIDASAMTAWLDNAYDPQIVQAYLAESQLMLAGQQTPEGVMAAVQEAAKRVRDGS